MNNILPSNESFMLKKFLFVNSVVQSTTQTIQCGVLCSLHHNCWRFFLMVWGRVAETFITPEFLLALEESSGARHGNFFCTSR